MKPIVPEDRQVITSSTHKVVDMSLDETSLVHLMNQFIDMYKDSELAVLREYSTNAWDSHVEAGNTAPIEVSLPDEWQPTLKIVDHGVGLSQEELENIYSKYGASTKRDSNEVVGMLGLGCKSALTYTEQFTIVAIKDGKRTVVSVSRNVEGAGSLHFIDESRPTDEPNGVTITVPARKENQFAEKARRLFQFWPEGSVLIDGKEPERIEQTHVVDDVYLIPGEQSYVVMGNVPYPVAPSDLGLDLKIEREEWEPWHAKEGKYAHSVLAYVPIGSVEPAPNRETLRDTDETKAVLQDIGKRFRNRIANRALGEVDNAPTPTEALLCMVEWRKKLPRSLHPKWAYRGTPIPTTFQGEQDVIEVTQRRYTYKVKRGFTVCEAKHREGYPLSSREEWLYAVTGVRAVWLYGFDTKFNYTHRRKLDHWAAKLGFTDVKFVLTKKHPRTLDCYRWIDPRRIFDWEQVRTLKLPKNETGYGYSGRPTGSYDCFHVDAKKGPTRYYSEPSTVQATDLDNTRPIYYFASEDPRTSSSRWNKSRTTRARPLAVALWTFEPTAQLLLIPPNREAKLKRDFPTARSYAEVLKEHYVAWRKSLSKDQLLALAMKHLDDRRGYRSLDPTRIDDPELRRAIRAARLDIKDVTERFQIFEMAGFGTTLTTVENPMSRYHLSLSSEYRYTTPSEAEMDHYYIYLNAVYATTRELKAA